MKAVNLRTEHLVDPIGIDIRTPYLSWNCEEGKKQTAYAADSKNHLIKTGTRGSGAVTVPPEIKEQYRLFNPDATDAEIQAHYSKYHKA